MKRTFYTLIFLVLINSNMGYAGQQPDGFLVGWFKWFAKPFVKYGAGQQALKNADASQACILNNPNLKTLAESAEKIAESNNVIAEAAIKMAKDSEIQTEHFIKMSNTIEQVATGVGVVVTIAGAAAVIKLGKEYLRPGHEQQLKTASIDMHKCIFKFKHGPKDEFNMPTGCSNQVDKFEKLAGRAALNHLRDAYSK